MYWAVKLVKISLIFNIMVVMLLNGCATNRYSVPTSSQQTDFYANNEESYHVVQSGETLSSIARIYGVDYKDIAAWNHIAPPYTIYPGQNLRIVSLSADSTSGYDNRGIPVNTSPPPQGKRLSYNKSSYKTGRSRTTAATKSTYHRVKRGETLYSIAKRYGHHYRTVAKWNNLSPPYLLRVGQQLRVASSSTQSKRVRRSKSSPSPTGQVNRGKSSSSTLPSYSPPHGKVVSHVVQRGETAYQIARQYGYSVEQIAYWNGLQPPYELKAGRRLRVAPLSASTRQTARQTGSSSATRSASYHQVVAGDTLYSLAKTYGVNVADIAIWNNLQPPYTLSPRQRLQVAPLNNQKVRNRPNLGSTVRHNTGYHTVNRGDTLYSIAKAYGYSVGEIATWNKLRYPYELRVGQTLRVYPPSGVLNTVRYKLPSRSTSSSSKRTYHTVKRGDTLYSISRRYGHSVAQIASWNGLVPPYPLSTGQRLRISP